MAEPSEAAEGLEEEPLVPMDPIMLEGSPEATGKSEPVSHAPTKMRDGHGDLQDDKPEPAEGRTPEVRTGLQLPGGPPGP